MNDVFRVIRKNWFSFFSINLEAMMDHFLIGVIKTIFFQRAAAHAANHFGLIRTDQVQHGKHIKIILERLGLADGSRNSIKHQ